MVRFITSSLLLAFAVLCFASAPSTAELSSVPSSEPSPKNINLSMAPVTPQNCTYLKSQKPDCTTYVTSCGSGDTIKCTPGGGFDCDGGSGIDPIKCKVDGGEVNGGDVTSDGVSNLLGNFGVATTGALLLSLL